MEMASGNALMLFIAVSVVGVGVCDLRASAVDKYVSHLSDYSLSTSEYYSIYDVSTALPLDASNLHFTSHRIRRRHAKQNLCDIGCECQKDAYNKFIQILCDFNKKRMDEVFGEKYEVPPSTTSLTIVLAPRSNFRLEEGIFNNNRVNRLYIEGSTKYNEQVEIGTNAFRGNEKGPFPDIKIKNCHTVVLRAKAFRGEFKLSIQHCHDVIIYPDTFFNTSFEGKFSHIEDLRIQEQSFNSSKAALDIISSNIENLYKFEASLKEIRFFNCSIGSVNRETFDVYTINSIVFEQCRIDIFKTKAITEKLFSPHLTITEGVIGTIEKDAIAGSGIAELTLSKNEIDTIQENAIYVTSVNATITGNRIKHLGNNWLRIKDFWNVIVSKNQFGDFGSMQLELEKSSRTVTCLIEGNFVTNPKPGSLNITNPHCIIREMSYFKPCTCNTSWLDELSSRDLKSESYCTIDNTLKFCFNTTIFNVLKYLNEVCILTSDKLECVKSINMKKIKGEFLKPEELENKSKHLKLIYILASVGVLIILVIIAFLIVHKIMKKRAANLPITDISPAAANGTTLKELRSFSNDDRRIINQTLDIIKQKYPQDVFEQVYNNTQILLRGNITEMERVKTIGDIVQVLGECQNPGEDFVAFTDILYRHLAPNAGPNLDPVYAEPTLPGMDINPENNSLAEGATNIDHIYAEPLSVQQPLLTNEYASPADRSELADLYSEPVSNDRDRKIIPPYAVISPKEHQSSNSLSQQPSTSKNLPDVLSLTKPMTNVQKMAQNFANNPNFHITRSPNTNRKIPKYTIPNRKKTDKLPDKEEPGPSTSAMASGSDSRSDHSGGSDITVKIDDIIEYADA